MANDGSLPWGSRPDPVELSEERIDPSVSRTHPSARIVARWVPLASVDPSRRSTAGSPRPAQPDPGSEVTVVLNLTAPATPGAYLLVLDVDSPLHGSLAAAGVAPGAVRVTVAPGGHSRGALINRPRREMAPVASAATPIAISFRSAGGSARTADRN